MTSMSGAVSPEWIGRAPHEDLVRGRRPVIPAKDPFYQPPAGFQHAEPGTAVEVALDGVRRKVGARVVRFPFVDPDKTRPRS